MGFLSRLLGGRGGRPSISARESDDAEKLNAITDWFIDNEKGLEPYLSQPLHVLCLIGATSFGSPRELDIGYRDGVDSQGLRNRATFTMWHHLGQIRSNDGTVPKTVFAQLLQEMSESLAALVLEVRRSDPSGRAMEDCIGRLTMTLSWFVSAPDLFAVIPDARIELDKQFSASADRHLVALFLEKNFLEVVFYILCWHYFSWYGEQFYAPPLE